MYVDSNCSETNKNILSNRGSAMTRLNHYNPNQYANSVVNLVDAFFNQNIENKATTSIDKTSIDKKFAPRVDVIENEQEYHFHVIAPGVKKEEIKLTIEDGVLRISGERKSLEESKAVTIHRIESTFGEFERAFRLPKDANAEALGAQYQDGILTITVQKLEKAIARNIKIL